MPLKDLIELTGPLAATIKSACYLVKVSGEFA